MRDKNQNERPDLFRYATGIEGLPTNKQRSKWKLYVVVIGLFIVLVLILLFR